MMKRTALTIGMTLLLGTAALSQSTGLEERITQEEFAVDLVKKMKLGALLPTAAIADDCVDLLNRLGISPLKGWDNSAYLTQEDYLVILSKAKGKEHLVHEKAMMVEQEMIEEINRKWQQSYEDLGRWLTLDELLHNETYFPKGPLKSPYGRRFKDENGDHRVDEQFILSAELLKLKKNVLPGD